MKDQRVPPAPSRPPAQSRLEAGGPRVTLFIGDLCDAPAEVLCTSTNPRLSLMMGTGAAVRERGGFEILRACQVQAPLPPGAVHVTTAGSLAAKKIVHCVASDASHRSSPEIICACVNNALAAAAGFASIAMPVFAAGHARFRFEQSLEVMAGALRGAAIDHVYIAVNDPERADEAREVLERSLGAISVEVGPQEEPEAGGWW
jgi:O-acetyl-ADP-ribose deacetylase (regulator of RNase III)